MVKDVCPVMVLILLKTMDGTMLKQKQNGCNPKKIYDGQENEVKKKDTDEAEIQIGMQMGRSVDGKKMNQIT